MTRAENSAKYYAAHRKERLAASHAYNATHQAEIKTWRLAKHARVMTDVRALKLLRGCIDCGYDAHAEALDFDHVRGIKVANVSSMTRSSYQRVAEIAKCEVRCANCHRVATAQRRKLA